MTADSNKIKWYVIHTYSGYENKVKTNLELKVQSLGMTDTIRQILVPMHDEVDIKDGTKRVVQRKVFPGYVLVEMEVNDRSWYVVRNTPGVTGFVGTTTKPIPLSDDEVARILHKDKKVPVKITVKAGDAIRITEGPFADHVATVLNVAADKGRITAEISAFGHATKIELEAGFFEPLS